MRRKNDEVHGNGDGHIKFRIIEFEIDGDNGTLAEGIKALTTALSKTSVSTSAQQRPALPTATPKSTVAAEASPPVEGELFPASEVEIEEEADEEADGNATTARPKRTSQTPRTPNVLSDIDLNKWQGVAQRLLRAKESEWAV